MLTLQRAICVVIFIYFISNTNSQDELSTLETKKTCRESNPLIASNKTDYYDLTETALNETVVLECHYCNENNVDEPKIWYKIDQFNNTPHEVLLDMNTNSDQSKTFVSTEHDLIIRDVTVDDAGIYYCRGLQEQETENMFNYIVDIISQDNGTLPVEKGNLSDWREYHDQHLAPINNLFSNSNGSEYGQLRLDLRTYLEVVTKWEHDWKPCEVCGRPQGEGTQEKSGYCRVKIENVADEENYLATLNITQKLRYFLNISQISCRSLLLEELFPGISNITKQIPDFVLTRHCEGTCSPDSEGLNKGWKFGKSKGFKYRKISVIDEGTHLTLVCPESTLENTVIWRRNGKVLKQGESMMEDEDSVPHLTVDAFNTLYLIDVKPKQEGNYTCQVDDIRMQQVRVFIVSKAKLLTREFLRHMMYLCFILALTSSCYCAGLVIVCKRKHKFKGYEEVSTETV